MGKKKKKKKKKKLMQDVYPLLRAPTLPLLAFVSVICSFYIIKNKYCDTCDLV